MTQKEIIEFLENNDQVMLKDYLDKSYEKLKGLHIKIDKSTIYLVLTGLLFYISSQATFQSFSVGPVTLNNVDVISILSPLVFAFLMFDMVVAAGQKAELAKVVKYLSLFFYKQKVSGDQLGDLQHNDITRLIMPFAHSTEWSKVPHIKSNVLISFIGAILALPLFVVIVIPIYVEFEMLSIIHEKFYKTFLGKVSWFLSIYTISLTIFYVVVNSIKYFRDRRI
ncbi:MAG: hypothetical protein ACTHLE_26725 [Agriterribacter sp.]